MEIKHLVSKYVYRIEPKPEGGFVARTTDPNVPQLEAPTREELQQKIQSTILAGLGVDFPGLKLPAHSGEVKFSFHVEKQPDGSFDIHSSDPSSGPINAVNHDLVESHFAEKLISFVGNHMLQDAPEALRAQLASGDIKVFINKSSGFTITTSHSNASQTPQLESSSTLDGAGLSAATSGPIVHSSGASFGSSGTPIDSSPITPGTEGSGRFLRIILVLLALAAVAFLFLKYR